MTHGIFKIFSISEYPCLSGSDDSQESFGFQMTVKVTRNFEANEYHILYNNQSGPLSAPK